MIDSLTPQKRYRIFRNLPTGGFSGLTVRQSRVVAVDASIPPHPDAVLVADDEPETQWQNDRVPAPPKSFPME